MREKLGVVRGGVALWNDSTTEGYFRISASACGRRFLLGGTKVMAFHRRSP